MLNLSFSNLGNFLSFSSFLLQLFVKDWLHLVGLIHDTGKILHAFGEPQWAVVGDNFPVGCAFDEDAIVFPHSFKSNPDYNHPVYRWIVVWAMLRSDMVNQDLNRCEQPSEGSLKYAPVSRGLLKCSPRHTQVCKDLSIFLYETEPSMAFMSPTVVFTMFCSLGVMTTTCTAFWRIILLALFLKKASTISAFTHFILGIWRKRISIFAMRRTWKWLKSATFLGKVD